MDFVKAIHMCPVSFVIALLRCCLCIANCVVWPCLSGPEEGDRDRGSKPNYFSRRAPNAKNVTNCSSPVRNHLSVTFCASGSM